MWAQCPFHCPRSFALDSALIIGKYFVPCRLPDSLKGSVYLWGILILGPEATTWESPWVLCTHHTPTWTFWVTGFRLPGWGMCWGSG